MTSMEIVQFLRPPSPLPINVQNSSIPLTLDVQFQRKPPSNDNQLIKRKHNLRMTIICYQDLPWGRISFSVSTHYINLAWLSLFSFHLAVASLSTFLWLYTFVCAAVQNIKKCLLFIIIHIFRTHFAIKLVFLKT